MTALQLFTTRISGYDEKAGRPSTLVPYLAYFLDEGSSGAVLTTKALVSMFEELRLRVPVNPSDTLRKCRFLVKARSGGYRLSHHGHREVSAALNPKTMGATSGAQITEEGATERNTNGTVPEPTSTGSSPSKKDVFVVHGRDERLRRDLFSFLRSLGLNPLEFEEMAHLTGSASPFTLEIIEAGFQNAQACVVLVSPDEAVSLRSGLLRNGDTNSPGFQPRPNVLVEAGMAMALQPKRTILVHVGEIREVTDLAGKNYVRLDNCPESRNKLLGRLKIAGCETKSHGSDWLTEGDFKPSEEGGK
jgi:predicted nucleotide-binding protein